MDSTLVLLGNLTRQRYPGGLWLLLLLLTWERQIFNHLYEIEGEDASESADLSLCPVLSHVGLQLDHVPLREGQFVAVLRLQVELGHASGTTVRRDWHFRRHNVSPAPTVKATVHTGCDGKALPDCCRQWPGFLFPQGFGGIRLMRKLKTNGSIHAIFNHIDNNYYITRIVLFVFTLSQIVILYVCTVMW